MSALLLVAALAAPPARADFNLGLASNYGLLFEGNQGNTLQITNVTINGNIGVGLTGTATDSGPSTINGSLNFSAANTGQFSNNNGSDVITGGVNYGVSGVTTALNTVNSLNTTLGALTGTSLNINLSGNSTQTINASSGTHYSIDGVGYEVFTITGFNTTNGNTLKIVGDAAGDNVVFNFTNSANFNNQVSLSGIGSDSVLWNFVGGSNLTGGPTLQINDNASSSSSNMVQGIFLDPNGPISVTNANVLGRVFGGDTHDFQYVSGSTITAPVAAVPAPPTAVLFGIGCLVLAVFRVCSRWRRIAAA